MKGKINKLIAILNWPENETSITYNASVKTLPNGNYELSIKNIELSPAALAALELANAPSGAKGKPKAPTTTELANLIVKLINDLKVELTAEFTRQINDLRAEIKAEINELRAEMNARFAKIEQEIAGIKKDIAELKQLPTIKRELEAKKYS